MTKFDPFLPDHRKPRQEVSVRLLIPIAGNARQSKRVSCREATMPMPVFLILDMIQIMDGHANKFYNDSNSPGHVRM